MSASKPHPRINHTELLSIDPRVEKCLHVILLSSCSDVYTLIRLSYLGICFLFNRDYRGLEVQLGIIRADALQQLNASSSFGNTDVDHTHEENEEQYDESEGETTLEH